jgi:hypothetical protein
MNHYNKLYTWKKKLILEIEINIDRKNFDVYKKNVSLS